MKVWYSCNETTNLISDTQGTNWVKRESLILDDSLGVNSEHDFGLVKTTFVSYTSYAGYTLCTNHHEKENCKKFCQKMMNCE